MRTIAPAPDVALEALRAEFEAYRSATDARIAALERPQPRLSRPDLAALAAILPAWAGAMGSAVCLTSELVRSDAAALRIVLAGWSSRRLGRLCRRAVGVLVDGYVIEAMGQESHAKLWRVVGALPEFSSSGNSDEADRRRRGGR